MPEFAWVKAPVFPPTLCLACNTHSHPDGFVDLISEDPTGRRHYLCASCVYTAGQKVGCLSPVQADDLRERVAKAHEDLLDIQLELDEERENKVVSLADVKKLMTKKALPA